MTQINGKKLAKWYIFGHFWEDMVQKQLHLDDFVGSHILQD